MKQFLVLLLVLLPAFVGCVNQEPEQSQSTTLPMVTLPPAYYEENSEIERSTGGVVKQFNLPDSGYSAIYRVGNGILLINDSELAQLRILSGESCIPSASLQLQMSSLQQCVALPNGFTYYDPESHTVFYLDSNLSQKHSVALTKEMTTPIISPDGSLIFYCVGPEVRALDVSKNISRLIKTQSVTKQSLIGTCFEGKVLICEAEDLNGKVDTLYISAKDGQTLCTENGILELYSSEDNYLALWTDGPVQQWVCGAKGSAARRFLIDRGSFVYNAMDLGGVVSCEAETDHFTLNFYSIPDAKRTAKLTLEGVELPDILFADGQSKCIWFVCKDHDGKRNVLLKWDLLKSAISDSTEYADVLYTAANPDQEALDILYTRVDELNNKHGVKIRIWQDAVSNTGTYSMIPEHQPETIGAMLDQLESILNEFPKKFVYKSIRGKLRINLVRSIDGNSEGQQHWDGRYAYITLCSGANIRDDFLKGFGIVVDSHVLGNSPVYDYWDTLNPSGFLYGKPDESYVNGEERFFVDMESMTSSMIDRSRVFWQAMLPDNAELFKIESMQKKLTMLCKAIRDAWGLEKKTDVYPWEQYLEKPIASKK